MSSSRLKKLLAYIINGLGISCCYFYKLFDHLLPVFLEVCLLRLSGVLRYLFWDVIGFFFTLFCIILIFCFCVVRNESPDHFLVNCSSSGSSWEKLLLIFCLSSWCLPFLTSSFRLTSLYPRRTVILLWLNSCTMVGEMLKMFVRRCWSNVPWRDVNNYIFFPFDNCGLGDGPIDLQQLSSYIFHWYLEVRYQRISY